MKKVKIEIDGGREGNINPEEYFKDILGKVICNFDYAYRLLQEYKQLPIYDLHSRACGFIEITED